MKVTREKTEDSQAFLKIEMEPAEVEESLEKSYHRLAKRVNIPGFRKGKAPRDVLERHIGKESLLEDALDNLIPQAYEKAIVEQEIEAFARPSIEITQTDPVVFEAIVPLKPVVELGSYREIQLTPESVEIAGGDVDTVIEQIRRQHAEWEPVERPVDFDDLAVLDVESYIDDKPFVNQQGVQYQLLHEYPLPAPGFAEQLTGMKDGEEREFKLQFPEDHPRDELAGKEASFKVKVTEIKQQRLPELDDAFATLIDPEVKTLDSLRERVSTNLRLGAEARVMEKFEEQVIDAVVDISQVEFPPVLVEMEIDRLLDQQKRQLQMGGKGMEEFLSTINKTEEELREELRPLAIKRITRSLLLDRITEEEKIQVDDSEISAELENMAQSANENKEEVRKYLDSPQARGSINQLLTARKTMQRLVEIAKGTIDAREEKNTGIVKSLCHMCLSCCGIDAHLENGRLVKATGMKEHPVNRLCVKAKAIPDLLYSPERLTHPMKKVDGTWQKITWDEAFDVIGDKLAGIKESHGAKALVVHLGGPLIGTEVPRVATRFCSLYGTPNYTTGASLCFAARGIGHGLSLGKRMMTLFPSYKNTSCIVVWGHNPQQSSVGEEANILSAKKRGAKLIVVDPRTTPLAKGADIHIRVRPGTDCALALGLLNVIIAEQLYDEDFVNNWTFGFDKLKERVEKYTPELVENITWVPADSIRQFARMYAAGKPAAISQGVSLDHCINGVQNSRAISILIAITGNLDILGGNIYNPPLKQTSLRIKGMVSVDEVIGAQYPVFGKFTGETTSMPVADAIITGKPYPVKALIVQGSNPVLTWPDSNKVRQALEQLDLLVVSDLFMTETAGLADIVLPATAFPERKIIKDYAFEGLPLIAISNRVIEPSTDYLEDWQIWSELGKKMGYADYFPWQSADELFTYLLEPSGITLEQLEQNPGGIMYRQLDRQRKYEEEGLDTPSGKVELFSQTMADYGYDPLPEFIEPQEQLADKPGFAGNYPFTSITGTRVAAFTHSQHRNIARLRKLVPQPLVELNPDSAQSLGIAEGDQVVVESPKGSIEMRATITADIPPRVISLQHGWNEANANILTDDEQLDPISGYPAFKTTCCQVRKIAE